MICKNCGKEISDNAKFCVNCGASVAQEPSVSEGPAQTVAEESSAPEQPAQPATEEYAGAPEEPAMQEAVANSEPKTSVFSKLKRYITAGGVAVAAFIVLLAVLGAKRPTVDLNDLVSVDFFGYDGYGYALSDFIPEEEFVQKYEKRIKYNSSLPAADRAMLGNSAASALYNRVGWMYELDKYGGLSNGDTVTIVWDVDEDALSRIFKCKIKHEPKELTVSGLEAVGSFDAFADVKVAYDGYNGYGTALVDAGANENGIYYYLDKTENLSNGDKITLSLGDDAGYYASTIGKVPETISKEFTVGGLQELGTFDAFANVQVSYNGMSNYATAIVKASDPAHPDIYYIAEPLEGLSNGDEIIVRAVTREVADEYENHSENFEYDQSSEGEFMQLCAEKYGSMPETLSKILAVEGLDAYLASADELSDEVLEQLKQYTVDEFKAAIAKGKNNFWWLGTEPDDLTWETGEYEYVGFYFLKHRNPGSEKDESKSDNAVIVVYKSNISCGFTFWDEYMTGSTGDIYYYTIFSGVYRDKAGKVNVDFQNTSTTNNIVSFTPEGSRQTSPCVAEFAGFASLDDLYGAVIAYNVGDYTYEDRTTDDETAAQAESEADTEAKQAEEETKEETETEDEVEEATATTDTTDSADKESTADQE